MSPKSMLSQVCRLNLNRKLNVRTCRYCPGPRHPILAGEKLGHGPQIGSDSTVPAASVLSSAMEAGQLSPDLLELGLWMSIRYSQARFRRQKPSSHSFC